ncbi:hypothetical protein AGMMS49991_09930 [Spirochaetia bacterium]|nr:hypothetical protein AGMMS49991_09930 [Spirochaetia bacterium]
MLEVLNIGIGNLIFTFFILGCAGWAFETIQESIVRRKFVNKGFFKGPFALSHAIGGLGVYLVGFPFKAYPALVFLAGLIVCTAVEYSMAIFLEKCFKVKCWDYTTYPHTRWCHYKGRICLTISLFFGVITLFVVYALWDIIMALAGLLGNTIWIVDTVLIAAFAVDAVFTITKLLRYKKAGIKMKNYAVFSDASEIE